MIDTKYECCECGLVYGSEWEAEECKHPTTNLERRRQAVERMIGKQVTVTRLGEQRPENTPGDFLYIPFPEYGVAIWLHRKEPI